MSSKSSPSTSLHKRAKKKVSKAKSSTSKPVKTVRAYPKMTGKSVRTVPKVSTAIDPIARCKWLKRVIDPIHSLHTTEVFPVGSGKAHPAASLESVNIVADSDGCSCQIALINDPAGYALIEVQGGHIEGTDLESSFKVRDSKQKLVSNKTLRLANAKLRLSKLLESSNEFSRPIYERKLAKLNAMLAGPATTSFSLACAFTDDTPVAGSSYEGISGDAQVGSIDPLMRLGAIFSNFPAVQPYTGLYYPRTLQPPVTTVICAAGTYAGRLQLFDFTNNTTNVTINISDPLSISIGSTARSITYRLLGTNDPSVAPTNLYVGSATAQPQTSYTGAPLIASLTYGGGGYRYFGVAVDFEAPLTGYVYARAGNFSMDVSYTQTNSFVSDSLVLSNNGYNSVKSAFDSFLLGGNQCVATFMGTFNQNSGEIASANIPGAEYANSIETYDVAKIRSIPGMKDGRLGGVGEVGGDVWVRPNPEYFSHIPVTQNWESSLVLQQQNVGVMAFSGLRAGESVRLMFGTATDYLTDAQIFGPQLIMSDVTSLNAGMAILSAAPTSFSNAGHMRAVLAMWNAIKYCYSHREIILDTAVATKTFLQRFSQAFD